MTRERINPMQAFWMSPDGEYVHVGITHVHEIIRAPERFGMAPEEPRRLYEALGEKLGTEQYARALLIERALMDGWIRGRGSRDGWSITIGDLGPRGRSRLEQLAGDFLSGALVVPDRYRYPRVRLMALREGLDLETSFEAIAEGRLRKHPERGGRSHLRRPAAVCTVCQRETGADRAAPGTGRRLTFWSGGALYLWPGPKSAQPAGVERAGRKHHAAVPLKGRYRHVELHFHGFQPDAATRALGAAQAMAGERPWVCQFCAGVGLCPECGEPLRWVVGSDVVQSSGRVGHTMAIPGPAPCLNPECSGARHSG